MVMSFIGNVFLGIASLILYYLVTSFYSKPIPGGDAGVGYAFVIRTQMSIGFNTLSRFKKHNIHLKLSL